MFKEDHYKKIMVYSLEESEYIFYQNSSFYLNEKMLAQTPPQDQVKPKAFGWTVFEKVLIYFFGDSFWFYFP